MSLLLPVFATFVLSMNVKLGFKEIKILIFGGISRTAVDAFRNTKYARQTSLSCVGMANTNTCEEAKARKQARIGV